jgi:hypothetical protein
MCGLSGMTGAANEGGPSTLLSPDLCGTIFGFAAVAEAFAHRSGLPDKKNISCHFQTTAADDGAANQGGLSRPFEASAQGGD